MTVFALLLLSGLTFIAACCNAPSWARLVVKGIRAGDPFPKVLARLAVSMTNIALVLVSWARLGIAIGDPGRLSRPVPWPVLVSFQGGEVTTGLHFADGRFFLDVWMAPPAISLVWLSLLLAGEVAWLWAAEVELQRCGRPRPGWWVFWTLSAVWLVLVLFGLIGGAHG